MAAKKKISQKQVNKESTKKIRTTAKNLKAVSKVIAKGIPKSRKTVKAKPTAKQIKATAKSAKKLVKVFRDALGRFTKAPTTKRKSKRTASQKPSSSKRQPKKAQTKSRASAKAVSEIESKRKKLSTSKARSKPKTSSQKPPKKQPTKKPTPKAPKKASKKVFTLRSLHPKTGESTLDFFDRIEANQDAFDALKGKDEYWIFTYANGKSRRVYKNIGLAIARMRQYDLTKSLEQETREHGAAYSSQVDEDLVQSIHFTRFSGSPLEYVMPNEERIRQRNAERVRIRREAKRILGKEKAPDFGGNIDLVEGLSKQNAALLERIKKLEGKKDESTTQRVSKVGAKGKSGSSKKGTTISKRKKSAESKSTKKGKSNRR